MLSLAGFGVIVSPLAGRLIDKYGSKLPMVIGALLLLGGTGLLLTYNDASPLIWLLIIMAVLGMSNGFNNISAQTALYEHVDPEDTGSLQVISNQPLFGFNFILQPPWFNI